MRARKALLGLLLVILPAAGAAQGLAIDLSDPDPSRLAELPGITPDEIGLLQEMAGLDPHNLGERGATRSISRERWLAWLPYLEEPSTGAGALRARVRGRTERSAAGVFRDRLELSLRGASGGLELRRRGTFDPRSRDQAVRMDGRSWVRSSRAIELTLGSVGPSLAGPEPWDDPLRSGTTTPPVLPVPGVGLRDGARGGGLRAGPVLAVGAMIAGRPAALLAAGGRRGEAFWGRSLDHGEGWGASVRGRDLSIAAVLHHPAGSPRVLRSVALRGSTAIASAWSLGEVPGKPTARVDATHGVASAGASFRLAGSARLGGSRPIDAALRVRVSARATVGRSAELLATSRRLRCDLAWSTAREGLQAEARARFERHRGAAMGAFVLEGSTGSGAGRLELALLARPETGVGWPLPDASELRALLGLRGRAVIGLPRGSLAARVLLPLTGSGPALRTTALLLEIEREAGP